MFSDSISVEMGEGAESQREICNAFDRRKHRAMLAREMKAFAQSIIDGKLPIGNGYFTWEDWRGEAQCALDSDDYSELERMIETERDWRAFQEWQASARTDKEAERREFEDFEQWRSRL